eukprot:5202716-Amphidinium_carterae.1
METEREKERALRQCHKASLTATDGFASCHDHGTEQQATTKQAYKHPEGCIHLKVLLHSIVRLPRAVQIPGAHVGSPERIRMVTCWMTRNCELWLVWQNTVSIPQRVKGNAEPPSDGLAKIHSPCIRTKFGTRTLGQPPKLKRAYTNTGTICVMQHPNK